MSKTVHLLRHAQSEFNKMHSPDAPDPMLFDPRLSDLGLAQVDRARQTFGAMAFDVIIVSPFTRALQTAIGIFGDGKTPMVVEALHREYLEHSGDVGREPEQLARDFPQLGFDHLPQCWWYRPSEEHNRPDSTEVVKEPLDHFAKRIADFRAYLKARPEPCILAVGHGSFFRHLSGQQFENCEMLRLDLS